MPDASAALPASEERLWVPIPKALVHRFGLRYADRVRWAWLRRDSLSILWFTRDGQPVNSTWEGSAHNRVMRWEHLVRRRPPIRLLLSRQDARDLLRLLMEHISEERYTAGWVINLEFILWDAINDPLAKDLLAHERAGLRHLSHAAGGWWAFINEDTQFLPLKRWLKLVERRAKENARTKLPNA